MLLRGEGGDVLRIAVVDDDARDAACVEELVSRYFEGDSGRYHVTCLSDGEDLLLAYRPSFDLVFLDIEMERMDGLTCARRLREVDHEVMIVFTTNMAQYAARGYDVGALGYLVKPLRYYSFALAMRRVEEALSARGDVPLWLADGEDKVVVASRDVRYVEVRKHELTFHTAGGSYTAWGSLKSYAEQLAPAHFVPCNRYYLVNLAHVQRLRAATVLLDTGVELEVSRRLRASLMQSLTDYFGMG